MNRLRMRLLAIVLAAATTLFGSTARADQIIRIGLSVPLSGSGAVWGRGADWMCKKAAQEVKEQGGVRVKGLVYNFQCISYDNKYSAAEGTKVAQTLLNRDGVRFMAAVGTVSALAAQSLTERQGVLLFHTSWAKSIKGPKFPLTFSLINSPVEIMPAMIRYVHDAHPQAKSIALLNVNDATGHEVEAISRPMWSKAGVGVLASDFYERGTTEFQPIAARLVSLKPDIIDLSTAPPADAGQVFKELDVLGFKGVKMSDNGTGTDGIVATGGQAVNGVYMGAATVFDGSDASEHQRKVSAEARAYLGESLSSPPIGCYDVVYMLKSGMEAAQSIEPKDVAASLPSIHFKTFYGGDTGFSGKRVYGSDQQPILPVFITQIEDGKVISKARIDSKAE